MNARNRPSIGGVPRTLPRPPWRYPDSSDSLSRWPSSPRKHGRGPMRTRCSNSLCPDLQSTEPIEHSSARWTFWRRYASTRARSMMAIDAPRMSKPGQSLGPIRCMGTPPSLSSARAAEQRSCRRPPWAGNANPPPHRNSPRDRARSAACRTQSGLVLRPADRPPRPTAM